MLLPRQESLEERIMADSRKGGVVNNGTTEEGGDDEETFFDAVEMSTDEWTKSKSVSFQPIDVVGEGGEGEREGGGATSRERVGEETKFGHTRNASGVSVNEAQLLLSSPVRDQLPSCWERTMLVSSQTC